LPFRLDARSLALGNNFAFSTERGPLDLLGYVEPIGAYDEIVKAAEQIELGQCKVQVISIDDLIRIKEHIQRPKDRESLMHLQAIRKLRTS
jgi:predicted nucleotidyltransferase